MPNSPAAPNPEIDSWARSLWEHALESPRGLQLTYNSKTEAMNARFALYRARNADRKTNAAIYPTTDPLHGASPWDRLRVTIAASGSDTPQWLLRITHQTQPPVNHLRLELL